MANKDNAANWLKLHYSILDWEWKRDPSMVAIWVHLLLNANRKTKREKGVTVRRGQLLTSVREISELTGLSVRQTRTCINRLKSTHEVTQRATHKYTIITICNFDRYQDKKSDADTPTDTQSDKQATQYRHSSDTVEGNIPISSFLNEKSKHIERVKNGEKRNKEKPPKGGKKKKENDSTDSAAPLVRSEEFIKFGDWIDRHAPAVAKMEKPFTEEQYIEISKNWDARDVRDVLEAMGNTKRLLKDYVSAYATCKNWLKRRQENKNKKNHRNSNLFVNDEWDEQ